ncbi:SIR2 family protein [Roseivivax sp. GX 12232]|uniref:SIR2 family protein n=1 Tax=Roseivivax sp. GX 12232 TaxID=2900547 RepID=UPI001E53322D|nr:SIR2 family protein [Roseivivax sp. GX 12232]MCE0507334.1 SIR2 family protein [Roseivivax sp. GX 12232]
MENSADIAEQFEKHLNSPQQTWLLGAGVSFPANIPLMYPLTDRVMTLARENPFGEGTDGAKVLDFVVADCGESSHIEHHLTHLGDLISIAERSRTGAVEITGEKVLKNTLIEVHHVLIETIADTVRWGFRPERRNQAGEVIQEVREGRAGRSIVDISQHRQFVEAIFRSNRAGLDFVRSPVEIFTTNYDTLIEDALALEGIDFKDGFIGGGVGFWNIRNYAESDSTRAIVSKLHGSIDWYRHAEGSGSLLRVRHGDTYPDEGGAVMIYPQATKYVNTQRDPFSEIFQRFRRRLVQGSDHVLFVCGYSFGDEHINDDIEMAMSSGESQLTIIAFSDEPGGQLPSTLQRWLSKAWGQRLFVASPKGIYQGLTGPVFPLENDSRDWWRFDGATKLFAVGLPKDIQEAMV